MGIKVMFLPSGNTVAFKDGQQVPEMSESWLLLYVQMIATLGIDVEQVDFVMPDTTHAKVITEYGRLNWTIRKGE